MDEAVVYVVDDDAVRAPGASRLIHSVGLEVMMFPSAQAFLAFTPPDRPACLGLDVRLPGPSGLDLQAALTQADCSVPIVVITGHGNVPTSVRGMKAGAGGFLQ